MNKYEELNKKYEELSEEFEEYKRFYENKTKELMDKNKKMGKRLDVITNIVEISKYINENIISDELIPMINDMIIGVLGVTHSAIYIKERHGYKVQVSNVTGEELERFEKKFDFLLKENKTFIINSDKIEEVYSIIGVPISLKGKAIGFIVAKHKFLDFFSEEHEKFISAIANPIGIALENNMLYKKIRENSIRDPLIGIYNRKYFFDTINKIIEDDTKEKFAIVMVDIDDFKKINDTYGHPVGDKILISLAKAILENITSKDILARYGGEEFIMYIEDAQCIDELKGKIENIRKNVEEMCVENQSDKIYLTSTFGVSVWKKGEPLKAVIKKADEALYKGKNLSKNVVIISH